MKRLLKRALDVHPPLKVALRALKWRLTGGEAELHLLPFLVARDRPALDVGGNVGIYAQALLPLCTRLTVLEPNPVLAADLRAGFPDRFRLIEAAASDTAGRVTLLLPRDAGLGGLGTIAPTNPLAATTHVEVDVAMIRIDDLDFDDLGFVKIDVEGHEAAVLDGAIETLRRHRPTILVEAEERHRPNAVAEVRARLEGLGYEGFMLRRGALTSVRTFDPAVHQKIPPGGTEQLDRGDVGDDYVNNFVFVPVADRPPATADR